MNPAPANQPSVTQREELFQLRLAREDSAALGQALKQHAVSFDGLLQSPVTCFEMHCARVRAEIIGRNPDTERILLRFARFSGRDEIQKLDLSERSLTYRYVRTESAGMSAAELIALADTHGGKDPKDAAIGVCVDECSRIQDYVEAEILSTKAEIVLFVYDHGKLERLSEAEASRDARFAAGYGMKPRAGLSLRDALIGCVIIDGSE